jgi:biopolymer transport protein ExbD
MKIARPPIRKARIEIVPMIDTIFFLLVFFMMSTLSMVKMEGLSLNIPKDAPAGVRKAPERITLAVSPNGDYLLDKRKIDVTSLADQFKAELAAHPNAAVVVNMAATQKTQTLISTMDILNEIMTKAGNNNPILIATPKMPSGAEGAPK